MLLGAVMWSYWPTLGQLVATWSSQADYSHGFLVLPLAVLFLWLRRDRRPSQWRPAVGWGLAVPGAQLPGADDRSSLFF